MERREFMRLAGMFGAAVVTAPKKVLSAEQKISDITTVVNDGNFDAEVYKPKGKAIVLFYANWDAESPKIFPLFRELVKEYGNRVKFCSYELDNGYQDWKTNPKAKEKWNELKKRYDVGGVPTTNMYLNGIKNDGVKGSPNERVTDKVIKDYITNWIENH